MTSKTSNRKDGTKIARFFGDQNGSEFLIPIHKEKFLRHTNFRFFIVHETPHKRLFVETIQSGPLCGVLSYFFKDSYPTNFIDFSMPALHQKEPRETDDKNKISISIQPKPQHNQGSNYV